MCAAVELGNAEVGQLDVVLGVNQQVSGLEIAVNDAAIVCVLQSRRNGHANSRNLAQLNLRPALSSSCKLRPSTSSMT